MSYHISRPHEVWKHEFDPLDDQLVVLDLPAEAQYYDFGIQKGPDSTTFCLWEVHPVAQAPSRLKTYKREFWFCGTGTLIPGWLLILNKVGTVQSGSLVWHLFEVSDQRANMEGSDNG